MCYLFGISVFIRQQLMTSHSSLVFSASDNSSPRPGFNGLQCSFEMVAFSLSRAGYLQSSNPVSVDCLLVQLNIINSSYLQLMQKYEKLSLIGEGAYGVVWKCQHIDTREIVAIKKFKESEEDDENVKKTTIREIKILRMLDHNNIVRLKQALRKKGIVFLIFQYSPFNLLEVIEKNPAGLQPEITKQIIYQILKGVAYMHSMNIIHRDIKPQNILVNESSKINVKICDFGFARELKSQQMTDYVATRWYRAPELLVGARYEKPVDVWAIGCLFGQLIDGAPLYPGSDDFDQLYLIQKSLGYINQDHYEYFIKNSKYLGKKLPEKSTFDSLQRRYYGKISNKGLDLLKKLLKMSPEERITASQALNHPYFDSIRQQSVKKSANETRVISACDINYNENKKRQFKGYTHDEQREATISSVYASKNYSKSQVKKKEDVSYNSSYLKVGFREPNHKSMGKNTKRSRENATMSNLQQNRVPSKTQMDFYPEMTEPRQTVLQIPTKMSVNKIYGSNYPRESIRFKSIPKKMGEQTEEPLQFQKYSSAYGKNQTPFILFGSNHKNKSKSREKQRPNINIVINNNTWLQSGSIIINK